MYSNGSEKLHSVHIQVMVTINLFKLLQIRHQSPQEFWDQFTAIRQICELMALNIRQSKAILKSRGETKGYNLFLYMGDRHKYGKIIRYMENEVLLKKDLFPKSITEAC